MFTLARFIEGRTIRPFPALFLDGCHAVLGQFTVGAPADARLFAHGFSANAVLAGITNPAFEDYGRFCANHAFLLFVTHDFSSYPTGVICQESVDYLNLSGVLENDF